MTSFWLVGNGTELVMREFFHERIHNCTSLATNNRQQRKHRTFLTACKFYSLVIHSSAIICFTATALTLFITFSPHIKDIHWMDHKFCIGNLKKIIEDTTTCFTRLLSLMRASSFFPVSLSQFTKFSRHTVDCLLFIEKWGGHWWCAMLWISTFIYGLY